MIHHLTGERVDQPSSKGPFSWIPVMAVAIVAMICLSFSQGWLSFSTLNQEANDQISPTYAPWQPTAEMKALNDDTARCEMTTMEGNWPIAALPEITLGQACARRAAFRTQQDGIALNAYCIQTNAFGKWPRPGLDQSITPALLCDALELKMGFDELSKIANGYRLLHP